MAFLMDPTVLELKLKYSLLKLFEITISDHSSGVNTLQCHFMYKNLNSKGFVSRCKCVSCFDTILVVNPEAWFSHDAAQNTWVLVLGWAWIVCLLLYVFSFLYRSVCIVLFIEPTSQEMHAARLPVHSENR